MEKRRPISAYRMLQIFRRDEFTCQYCGQRGGKLEIDHVIPVVLGGSNSKENLVTACRRCNRKKGKKLLETVQRWENGERSPRMGEIESLSNALKRPLSYFISMEDDDKEIITESFISNPDDGRDIMTDNKAGHLIFRHGNTIVDLPDTPENKGLYWRVVEKMLSFPAVEME